MGRGSGEIQRKAARGETAEALARLEGCGAEAELVALARDCLAAEPADRPRDAGAVATRLEAHFDGVQDRLRHAEIDRATAAARAEEARRTAEAERRARRSTQALAAAVVALIGLAGGGYVWLEHARDVRRARTVAAADAALAEAARLRGEALAAPPAEQDARWAQALAVAARAEEALDQGEPDPDVRRRVAATLADLTGERDARRADRRLLVALEAARGRAAAIRDWKASDAAYAVAFRGAGLDFDTDSAEQAVAWIGARSAPAELVAYLDDWLYARTLAGRPPADLRLLADTAERVDRDPDCRLVREAVAARGDAGPLRVLADDGATLDRLPASTLVLLGRHLRHGVRDHPRAVAVLRRAWNRNPADYWANYELGHILWHGESETPKHPGEAVRFFTAAVALRPDSGPALSCLGQTLAALGFKDEALDMKRRCFLANPEDAFAMVALVDGYFDHGEPDGALRVLEDLRRDLPDSATLHIGLADYYARRSQPERAIAECREAIRLRHDSQVVHQLLGWLLEKRGDRDEALAELREAVRIHPEHHWNSIQLGDALQRRGRFAEAVAVYRSAARLSPSSALSRNNLAFALLEAGDPAAALPEVRESVRLDPQGFGLTTLAETLTTLGRFAEAADALGPAAAVSDRERFPDVAATYRRILPGVRDLAAAAAALDALAAAAGRARADLEAVDLAALAAAAGRPALAARLYDVALAVSPARARRHRVQAALASVRAATAGPDDGPAPGIDERAAFRTRALGWLRDELAARSKDLESADAPARADVAATLHRWQEDPDLTGVRDPDALTALPEAERAEWPGLWQEVDRQLKNAEADR